MFVNHKVSNVALRGKKILITRAKQQSSTIASLLTEAGATPFFLPLIEMKSRKIDQEMNEVITGIEQFDWIVFTSANGVKAFFSFFKQELRKPAIAVVGRKTALCLSQFTTKKPVVPKTFHANALASELGKHIKIGANILIIKGQLVNQTLAMELQKTGANVRELIVYDTLMPEDAIREARKLQQHLFDYVTLTSASTVTHLARIRESVPLQYSCIACIGPITANAAVRHGFAPLITANEYSAEGLIHAIVKEENARWN
ncbi:uroporphyrinogen-III methyltransferase [Bacillus sp. JCM 19045]|nr:uroporphyrinogen-III methyltransferase [Bacillus sp. JCM 19045]